MSVLHVDGYGDVTYFEVPEQSPVYTFSNAASRVERTFRLAWADRDAFVKGMLGYCKIINTGEGAPYDTYITRQLPLGMPDTLGPTDNDQWLFATSISRMVGQGPQGISNTTTDVAEYETCQATVVYESLTYKLATDLEVVTATNFVLPVGSLPTSCADESTFTRYITRMQKPSCEFVTIDKGLCRWVTLNNPGTVNFASARLVPSIELTYTWHQVPFVPEAVYSHVGTVNQFDFVDGVTSDTGKHTFPAGTLLLVSSEVKPYRMTSGGFVNDIVYRMKYYEPEPKKGHNFWLRYYPGMVVGAGAPAGAFAYTKITDSGVNDILRIQPNVGTTGSPYPVPVDPGTGTGLYKYKDFTNLFRFKSTD